MSKFRNFVNKHGVACGGDWTAMLMSAIRNGIPHVHATLDLEKEYQFTELADIIENWLANNENGKAYA